MLKIKHTLLLLLFSAALIFSQTRSIGVVFVECIGQERTTERPFYNYKDLYFSKDTFFGKKEVARGDLVYAYGSVNDYFSRVSKGACRITGRILNQVSNGNIVSVKLPKRASEYTSKSDFTTLANDVRNVSGISVSGYNAVVFVGLYSSGTAMFHNNHSTGKYAMVLESPDKSAYMGIYAHEIAHALFGWADEYNGSIPFYNFLMGKWGKTWRPPNPNPYYLQKQGWISYRDIAGGKNNINDGEVYRIRREGTDEYFLAQYRSSSFLSRTENYYDHYFSPGLLLFHIDPKVTVVDRVQFEKYVSRGSDVFSSSSSPNNKTRLGIKTGFYMKITLKDLIKEIEIVEEAPNTPTYFSIQGDVGENPYLIWPKTNNDHIDVMSYNIYQTIGVASEQFLTNVTYSDFEKIIIPDREAPTTLYIWKDKGVIITNNRPMTGHLEVKYRISAVDAYGLTSPKTNYQMVFSNTFSKRGSGTIDTENIITKFELHQNWPNPFNPSTNINFDVPDQRVINISIYNMLGEKVIELFNGIATKGSHSIEWNGKDQHGNSIPSGVYIYNLKSDNFFQSRKMMLLK